MTLPLLSFDAVLAPQAPADAAGWTFSLAEGEGLLLMGDGPSGKTAVCRLAAGLLRPRAGSVRWAGTDPAQRRGLPDPHRCCLVPAGGGLISNLSMEDNLLLPLRYHQRAGEAALRRQAAALLDALGAPWPPPAIPERVAPGLRIQVAVARALALAPRLLILDEPLEPLGEVERGRLCAAFAAESARRPFAVLATAADPGQVMDWLAAAGPSWSPRADPLRRTATLVPA